MNKFKTKYKKWHDARPTEMKYDEHYQFVFGFIGMLLVSIATIIIFAIGFFLVDRYGLSNILETFLLVSVFLSVVLVIVALIFSTIMVVKSELEKYIDYKKGRSPFYRIEKQKKENENE